MMRIKESIHRRKLIQQLNDEFEEFQHQACSPAPFPDKPSPISDISSADGEESIQSEEERRINNLRAFVKELNMKLTHPQKRALRVTWKRLSEAPKTSGRGNLQIMEKIFDRLIEQEPGIMSIFYRSAFIKCIEDRKNRRQGKSIATIRDHAHILIDFIDGVLCVMFDQPITKPIFDPITIGKIHSNLNPLGFDRHIWLKLGECFAEVMFSQECVRGYPHAASAWSTLAVASTDKMFSHGKIKPPEVPLKHSSTSLNLQVTSLTSTPSQSCKSLDLIETDVIVPPNTQRTPNSDSSPLPQSSSSRPFSSSPSVDSSTKSRHQFETNLSFNEFSSFQQRIPRQLPYRSACGRYIAKKEISRLQARSKSSSFSNL